MASRGSAIQRFLKYVREADVDEVRVAFTLAKEIVERRLDAAAQARLPLERVAKRTRTRTRKAATANLDPNGKLAASETLADA